MDFVNLCNLCICKVPHTAAGAQFKRT
uniref:Uncharacterized protein n=1 Tax=Anguilla anguilla TaxID=7936 RepID=A0A0E9UU27_ANGAN